MFCAAHALRRQNMCVRMCACRAHVTGQSAVEPRHCGCCRAQHRRRRICSPSALHEQMVRLKGRNHDHRKPQSRRVGKRGQRARHARERGRRAGRMPGVPPMMPQRYKRLCSAHAPPMSRSATVQRRTIRSSTGNNKYTSTSTSHIPLISEALQARWEVDTRVLLAWIHWYDCVAQTLDAIWWVGREGVEEEHVVLQKR